MKISPVDYKFVPVDVEPGFDPEHNKRVIAETIKKSEAMRRKKEAEFKDKLGERAAAIARYIRMVRDGETKSSAKDFFGAQEIERLVARPEAIHHGVGSKVKKKAQERIDRIHGKT